MKREDGLVVSLMTLGLIGWWVTLWWIGLLVTLLLAMFILLTVTRLGDILRPQWQDDKMPGFTAGLTMYAIFGILPGLIRLIEWIVRVTI